MYGGRKVNDFAFRQYLTWYLQESKKFYLAISERVQKDCDLIVDGTLSTEEMTNKILEAINGKL